MANPGTFKDAIIAGTLKGRPLILPSTPGLRPTKNRVRQAMFNLLGSKIDWQGLTVLDLCCGSGALGLEAFSRGAAKVWLVDVDTAPALQNIKSLGLASNPAVQLVKANAATWAPPAPADVILADPPYTTPLAQQLLNRAQTFAHSGTWWALEVATGTPLTPPTPWQATPRAYGASTVFICHS